MSRKKVEKTNLRRERCVLALLLLVVCVGPVGAQDAAGRVRVHVLPVAVGELLPFAAHSSG